ncbi:MAG TPA: hypothetical protein VFA03_16145 [Acetobacteraceae bacterium]|nr:hypothetical protein [Acetobacteraceae bacterium]
MRRTGSALLAGALSACSLLPTAVHRFEGGEINQPQPPPPGENRPYPNLASVPARPAPPDQAALAALSQSLTSDRENARHLLMPAPDPSLPSTSPALFGVGTVPPPAPQAAANAAPDASLPRPAPAAPTGGAAASLAAANGPTVSVPSRPPVAAQPLSPPPPAQVAAAAAPTAAPPSVPPAPPRAPAGLAPTQAAARTALPPAPPRLPGTPASTVAVDFARGSAVLPAQAADALKALAAKRGNHPIAVVGGGDAASDSPAAQGEAVMLGLQRAQAMAQALAADGVPADAIRLDSQASGRGGTARILE